MSSAMAQIGEDALAGSVEVLRTRSMAPSGRKCENETGTTTDASKEVEK